MSDRCVSCGSADRRTDVMPVSGGMDIHSHYCGGCGATWGYQRTPEPPKGHRPAAQPEGRGRKSDGSFVRVGQIAKPTLPGMK